jgi:signal transduction histidine kinase
LKKRKSIVLRVTAYLLAYVIVLLGIIWLSHYVFMPVLYRLHRQDTVREAVTELGNALDTPQFSRLLSQTAREQSACIRVLRRSGTEIYSLDYMPYSALKDYTKPALFDLWHEANGGGGEEMSIYAMDSVRLKRLVPSGVYAILYVKVFDTGGREPTAIFYNSTITPIDGMLAVLQYELWWITIAAVLFAALMGYKISKDIARPITKINDQARRLKEQDYSVVFDSDNYREVAELSQTLNATGRTMEMLDGLRRELIANVSHDLRTPLAMITAYSEIMRDVPGENTPENVQIIIDEANRLTELVNDVLLLPARPDATERLNLSFYDFAEACRSTIARYQKLSLNKKYRITYEGPDHIQVKADRIKISQVIYNLLNNAISHAGDNPEIVLRLDTVNDRIRVGVIDHGVGIPEEKQRLIWDEFYSDSKDEKFHAGLGLTIVRRILELHHADYGVESKPGEGSTFWFTLNCYEK